MPFNASPIRSRAVFDAGRRSEVRENRVQKHIEVCVSVIAQLLFAEKYATTIYGLPFDGSAQECVKGIKGIDPGLFEALEKAFNDIENGGIRGSEILASKYLFDEGTRRASSRLSAFSDTQITQFAHSMTSFLWRIHEKNLYARTLLARVLAVDGSLLNKNDDRKNGIVATSATGNASPLDNGYTLCHAAENKLAKSESHGRHITVNKHLLVKFDGYVTALCTQSFRTANGQVFLKGVFYSPDNKTMDVLRNEYRDKKIFKTNIELPDATWYVIRAYNRANLRSSPLKPFRGHS